MEEGYTRKDESSMSHNQPSLEGSNSDLMTNAKVVAEAAKTVYSKHSIEGVDKARVTEAAKELYGTAQGYMGGPHRGSETHTSSEEGQGAAGHRKEEEEEESHGSGGGFGNYVNMAKGFMK